MERKEYKANRERGERPITYEKNKQKLIVYLQKNNLLESDNKEHYTQKAG